MNYTFAQNGSISGTILDETNSPLIGANIVIKNTVIGTASDADGKFFINNLKNGKYFLEVSMVGYQKFISDEIIIIISNDNTNLSITLKPAVFQIDQVVVSAGKHEQKLSDLPVSVSVINSDRISRS